MTTREFDGSRRLSLRDPSEVERLVLLIGALRTVQPVAIVLSGRSRAGRR